MKVTLPEVEINENEGFSNEKDIFNRKNFGENLISLFENSQEELVVALNAPWGEGKTTFIRMWQNHIKLNQEDTKIKTIYFDAFKNDYQKDPFLAITSEIYSFYDTKEEKTKEAFLQNAKQVGKSLARGSLKIGTKLFTSGLVDDTILETTSNDISSLLNNNIDTLIENRIKNHHADKNSLDKFKIDLENFIKSEDEKPLVFIIDELDRCRPDFALELLEQIKHIFSVENLHFLLVVNSQQLEASIKSKYGNDINATQYLQKFITFTLELHKKTNTEYHDYNKTFVHWALNKMLEPDEKMENEILIETMEEIVNFYNPSFRAIERILSHIAILHNMSNSKYYQYYQIALALMCYIKVSHPKIFLSMKNKTISAEEIITQMKIDKFSSNDENTYYLISLAKLLIIYDYSDDENKKIILEKNPALDNLFGHRYHFYDTSLFESIIETLSTLK
jgi:hypothetical protein